jgi:alpha-glucosidase (family GH31 glycosyl hydrolase)
MALFKPIGLATLLIPPIRTCKSLSSTICRYICSFFFSSRYGNHPFYLEHRLSASTNASSSHGVFISSAAGADILLLTPPSSNVSVIEYRLLGGTLDLYFFAGPTSQAVVEQYSAVVGTPTWAPLWAFGFHLCRWGWANVSEVQSVVARMKEANIPLESEFLVKLFTTHHLTTTHSDVERY